MLYPECWGANPLFPQSHDFSVVHRGEQHGMGVICYRDFEAGELVAEIHGEVLPEITQHTLEIEPGKHLLDLHFTGYLLHACEPNVHVDMQARRVTALRPIQAGEYLTMDYAQTESVLYRQFPCSCGSSQCRGWITGFAESVDELAQRKHHIAMEKERKRKLYVNKQRRRMRAPGTARSRARSSAG